MSQRGKPITPEQADEIMEWVRSDSLDWDLIERNIHGVYKLTRQEIEHLTVYLRASMMDHPQEIRDAWRNTPVGELCTRLEEAIR